MGGWFHEPSEQPTPDTLEVAAPKEALGTENDGDYQDARPEGQGVLGMRSSLPISFLTDALLTLSPTEHCMDFLNHSGANKVMPSENFTSPVMEFWE